jgi:plastocyanin
MATHTGHNAQSHGGHGHGGHGHGAHVSDRTPAFVGLIAGGLFVGGVLYAVVAWTNTQFEGHTREKAPVAGAKADSNPVLVAQGGAAPAGAAGGAAGGGTVHQVRMLGDAQGYRFEPANITVKAGDNIRFVNVSGGPHNAAFDPAAIPDDVEAVLSKNMPEQMSPLAGKLLVNPNETYTISFAGVKPGAYDYFCSPHVAMNMKGVITVQ